ncbi:hypothetical protein E2562_014354 [Oryza meyeriana var. granulata]|uniref:Uncharacterized protein n=1 Tax=Oryza meyeriana var. granulata TaxID=110450 RepID=A0A6G1C513_9ORYZ|nr:hypothetical protein E2562_014354 [Oryza meyeriana var. granulata]
MALDKNLESKGTLAAVEGVPVHGGRRARDKPEDYGGILNAAAAAKRWVAIACDVRGVREEADGNGDILPDAFGNLARRKWEFRPGGAAPAPREPSY